MQLIEVESLKNKFSTQFAQPAYVWTPRLSESVVIKQLAPLIELPQIP